MPRLPKPCKPSDATGHAYAWVEEGCLCIRCGAENPDAPKLKIVSGRTLAVSLAVLGCVVAAILVFPGFAFLPILGMAGYRDREPNFMRIVGTSIASGSDQEDSVDLSNYGVSVGSMMGMRIWKVELGVDAVDTLHGRPAQGALETSELTVRTITSAGTPCEFTDDGLVSALQIRNQGANTTSGPSTLMVSRYGEVFPKGLLIVSDRLYLNFDNNTSTTTLARARIWYTLEKMTEGDWREAWEVWRRA